MAARDGSIGLATRPAGYDRNNHPYCVLCIAPALARAGLAAPISGYAALWHGG